MSTRILFNRFKGRWRLVRTISDGSTVSGLVTFTQLDNETLLYREEGRQFFREYIYAFEEGSINVYHHGHKSTLLHPLIFDSASSAIAIHHCPPDTYEGRYTFESEDRYTLSYVVRGPAKNFTITSILTTLKSCPR